MKQGHAAAKNADPGHVGTGQCGNHVQIQGLAGCAGSLVRSRTAILFTVAGRASSRCFWENGLYRRLSQAPPASGAEIVHNLLRSPQTLPMATRTYSCRGRRNS